MNILLKILDGKLMLRLIIAVWAISVNFSTVVLAAAAMPMELEGTAISARAYEDISEVLSITTMKVFQDYRDVVGLMKQYARYVIPNSDALEVGYNQADDIFNGGLAQAMFIMNYYHIFVEWPEGIESKYTRPGIKASYT